MKRWHINAICWSAMLSFYALVWFGSYVPETKSFHIDWLGFLASVLILHSIDIYRRKIGQLVDSTQHMRWLLSNLHMQTALVKHSYNEAFLKECEEIARQ